ncbi:MAG: toll/interleukin-1 receptor domain-containing protein, partial [Planctomycetes bacterium]|nr:toll/interleukin-1 receptor domain-containing protein [Planctomycetota bacterium]
MLDQEKPKEPFVFLSYCREDEKKVERLADDLSRAGLNVWWDHCILPGQDWQHEIRNAIKNCAAFILCVSEAVHAKPTSGVHSEIRGAIDQHELRPPGSTYLQIVRLSSCNVPDYDIFDQLQHVDLFPEGERSRNIPKLIQALH